MIKELEVKEIDDIIYSIKNGGVVLIPTDTVYGLAVSPLHKKGIDKLYKLKSRPRNMNLPIMVSSVKQLKELGLDINKPAQKLLESEWVPGALSLVLGFVSSHRVKWLTGRKEVAIRIPNDERLLCVLEKTGPLLVTSANKHKNSTANNVEEILEELFGLPDLIIEGGQSNETPSTIVNCHSFPLEIEREGFITKEIIFKILDNE